MFGPQALAMQERRALLSRQLLGGKDDNKDDAKGKGNDQNGGGLLDPLLTPIGIGGNGQTATNTATNTVTTGGLLPTVPNPLTQTSPGLPTTQTSSSAPNTASVGLSSAAAATSSSSAPTSASEIPVSVVTSPVVTSGTDGQRSTSTAVETVSGVAAAASSSAAVSGGSSFLDNKAAVGAVSGISGLIGLALLVFIVAFAMRRSRRKKLLNEAVSFDPSYMNNVRRDSFNSMERGSTEKGAMYNASDSGHGHGAGMAGYGAGYSSHAPSNQGYYDSAGYSQPIPTYNAPAAVPGVYGAGPVQPPSAIVAAEKGNRVPRVAPPSLSDDMYNPYDGYDMSQTPQPEAGPSGPSVPPKGRYSTGSVNENPISNRNLKVANE